MAMVADLDLFMQAIRVVVAIEMQAEQNPAYGLKMVPIRSEIQLTAQVNTAFRQCLSI